MTDPKCRSIMESFGMEMNVGAQMASVADGAGTEGVISQEMMEAMMEGMPLRQMLMFMPQMKSEMLEQIIEAFNA